MELLVDFSLMMSESCVYTKFKLKVCCWVEVVQVLLSTKALAMPSGKPGIPRVFSSFDLGDLAHVLSHALNPGRY